MSVGDAFLEHVIPALGGVVGVCMFASPLRAVLRARREKNLGDLNPMPYPAILANCIGWICYSFVLRNNYVYVPNQIGFMLGLFYTMSCYSYMDSKSRDRQLAIVMLFALVISVVGAVGVMRNLAYDPLRLLWGFTANGILLVYYASPLSTIYMVIRTRCSSSLYWPLSTMNTINGGLWTAYGIAITDYFIWIPNAIGAALAAFTLVLIWVFPSKVVKESPPSSDSEAPLDPEKLAAATATIAAAAAGPSQRRPPSASHPPSLPGGGDRQGECGGS